MINTKIVFIILGGKSLDEDVVVKDASKRRCHLLLFTTVTVAAAEGSNCFYRLTNNGSRRPHLEHVATTTAERGDRGGGGVAGWTGVMLQGLSFFLC